MNGTERLYYNDSNLLEFTARVVGRGQWKGAPSLILDRTAFYPESGGQLGDRGTLGDLRVIDAQVDDAGVVHHVLQGSASEIGAKLPADGDEMKGVIERERRRQQMAVHTGQHMLTAALLDVAKAPTVSVRLGESTSTIDVERDALSDSALALAENLVNRAVEDDLTIRAFFPSPDELAALPIRRASKVTENIRVIQIGDFDVTPCGGTHCTHSSQVGILRIAGTERYKGKIRVTFSAGRPAREQILGYADVLATLARTFNCRPIDVPAAIDKLKREAAESREALERARLRMAESVATELVARLEASGGGNIVTVLDEANLEVLRAVVSRLTALPDVVAFLGGRTSEGLSVVIARSSASRFDCGAFMKRAAAAAGGRGGGRPERAEGRLPGETDWERLVASLLEGSAS